MKKYIAGAALALTITLTPVSTQAAGLTETQIQAILGILNSFGADATIVANVNASLRGQASSAQLSPSACLSLRYDLYADQTDSTTGGEVSKLQRFLGVNPTGFFGPLTQEAVQRWQASRGIVSSGSPDTTGYGYVGPRTRSAMSCIPNPFSVYTAPLATPTQVPPASPFIPKPSSTQTIMVVYPNGGEQLVLGSGKDVDFRITWSSLNLSGTASIYLHFTDGATCLLGSVPVAEGSYPVSIKTTNHQCQNIPREITTGTYKILLTTDTPSTSGDQKGISDSSDDYFTLTVVPQTTPTITNVTAKASDPNSVYAGQKAYIYGSGLLGSLTIKLGIQEVQTVTTVGYSDTYAEFTVPTRPQTSVVSMTVRNSAGLTSEPHEITIVVPTY